jgi:D-alanine-D-alanine ligase
VEASGKRRTCPADIDDKLASLIYERARQAYLAAGCRDYARIDLRLDAKGEPCVAAVHAQEILARKGSVADMADAAGLGWRGLMRRIVELAAARNGAESAGPSADNVVPLMRKAGTADHSSGTALPASKGW